MLPETESTHWGGAYGYYFYLQPSNKNNSIGDGIHVYIHEEGEKLTEKNSEANVFREYLYVQAGDSIQVNLKMSKYKQLPRRLKNCNISAEYSRSKCIDDSVNQMITEYAGCKTPWVLNENLPECSNHEQVQLIVTNSTSSSYLQEALQKTTCIIKCTGTVFLPLLQAIREIDSKAWSLKIYFSSSLVTQMEEVVGYDWNNLIADLGGSLGFLLGLSVFGSLGLLENVVLKIKNKSNKKISPDVIPGDSIERDDSINVYTIHKDA